MSLAAAGNTQRWHPSAGGGSVMPPPFSPQGFLYKGIAGATRSADQKYAVALCKSATTTTTLDALNVYGPYPTGFNTAVSQGSSDVTPFYIINRPDHPRVPVFYFSGPPFPSSPSRPTRWASGQTYTGSATSVQQYHFTSVPVPMGPDMVTPFFQAFGKPVADTGTDHHACIWDPFHDEFWEMWKFSAVNQNAAINAGSTVNRANFLPPVGYTPPGDGTYYVQSHGGYLGPKIGVKASQCLGLLPDPNMGASATDFTLYGGRITHDDLMAGEIKHMLSLDVPCGGPNIIDPIHRGDSVGTFSQFQRAVDPAHPAPGQSGDPYDFSYQVPEGAFFRIRPDWVMPALGEHMDVTVGGGALKYPELVGAHHSPSLVVEPIHLMIWKAMRDYGLYVMDQGSIVGCYCEGIQSLSTHYSRWTLAQHNAQMTVLGPTTTQQRGLGTAINPFYTSIGGGAKGPINPFAMAPWLVDSLGNLVIEQVDYPF